MNTSGIGEIEGKYTRDPTVTIEAIETVLRSHGLPVNITQRHQEDQYFDILPDFLLGGSDASLRRRIVTERDYATWTFKLILFTRGAVKVREEPEINVSLDVSDDEVLEAIPGFYQPIDRLRELFSGTLSPSTKVFTDRIIMSTELDDAPFEICLDQTFYSYHDREALDSELEIEQKGGSRRHMDKLINVITQAFPGIRPQKDDKYRRSLNCLGIRTTRAAWSFGVEIKTASKDEIANLMTVIPLNYKPLFEHLLDCWEIQRLGCLSQLSLLYDPEAVSEALLYRQRVLQVAETDAFLLAHAALPDGWFISVMPEGRSYRWFSQSRLQHSIKVSELAFLLGNSARLSEQECTLLAVAGFVHDTGHLAFSHCGEVLWRQLMNQSHEDRTIEFVRSQSRLFASSGFSMSELENVLGEQGIGIALSVADTLGYLVLDGREAGRLFPEEVYQSIIQNFRLKNGVLVVNDELRSDLQEMLNFRHAMYSLLYLHPYARIAQAMQRKAMRWLIEQSYIEVEKLALLDDRKLLEELANLAVVHPEIEGLIAAFFVDHCQVNYFRPIYVTSESDPKTTEDAFMRMFDLSYLDLVVAPPYPCGNKTIVGQDRYGNITVLKSDITEPFHPYENKTIIAISERASAELTPQKLIERIIRASD